VQVPIARRDRRKGTDVSQASRTLHADRWQTVVKLATDWCDAGTLPCIAAVTGTTDAIAGSFSVGRQQPGESIRLRDDAIFLVASITKPIVGMAALQLIERGQLSLADRVSDYIPEFGREGKYGVEIRHLLTHTSGLPDMLPDNNALRQSHATLGQFVQRTCDEPLAFSPGRGVQYQSMGFAVLGEIIARVSGKSCSAFLKDDLFHRLGLTDAALGAPDDWYQGSTPRVERIPAAVVPEAQVHGTEWNWNSRYWRQLGAPWGGLLITARDLALLAQLMLRGGTTTAGQRLLSPAAIAASTRNQLECMRDIPMEERRCRPWGLGWRLDWPAHSANFGDLLGPRTYGHWGATGTVLWIDPDARTFAIILTTLPQEPSGKYLARLSNAIAAAWE
jgi:CubicO group peptidase (beta-lactamase class C family)